MRIHRKTDVVYTQRELIEGAINQGKTVYCFKTYKEFVEFLSENLCK